MSAKTDNPDLSTYNIIEDKANTVGVDKPNNPTEDEKELAKQRFIAKWAGYSECLGGTRP